MIVRSALAICAAVLGLSAAADARPGTSAARAARKASKAEGPSDPAHWFATRQGLLRVYQERNADAKAAEADAGAPPAAGISCEVVESTPKDGDSAARTRESCTMIAGRKPKGTAQLTYELREGGIYMIEQKPDGHDAVKLERLLLPAPARKGKSWSEKHGAVTLVRTVKSAGKSCKTADRKFGDCLVLAVTEREGKKVRRSYSETYAAGVGLVEDAQWELIDVKGL